MNWIVSQIGAREHYSIPRAFHQNQQLRLLYTEAWCCCGRALLRRGPQFLAALAARYHPDLPGEKIVSCTAATVCDKLFNSPKNAATVEQQYLEFLRIGQWYDQRVARHLNKLNLDPKSDAFFSYNTGCLESLRLCRQRGIASIVDQIDPARTEEQIVRREMEKWPGWQTLQGTVPEAYWQRLSAEWNEASLVLVNSDWSRSALIEQGVPPEKLIVIPLAYEPGESSEFRVPGSEFQDRRVNRKRSEPGTQNSQLPKGLSGVEARTQNSELGTRNSELTVLWLGSVILRKGIQYLLEAARNLNAANVRFIIAGPIGISEMAVKSAPFNVSFIGRVNRDRTADLYRQADLFVLPTLSDGFAITQLEAMAHGLPVITTPNCGQVVTDGVDGLIVPAGDSTALAAAITQLEEHRDRLPEMSRRAIEKSKQFSLNQCAQRLEAAAALSRQHP